MPIEVPTSSDRNLVVIKVGTSSLATTEATSGIPCLDKAAFQRIGAQVIELHKDNDVVIVTSGAIAAGMGKTRMSERPNPETQMEELQRLASVGNINLPQCMAKCARANCSRGTSAYSAGSRTKRQQI